MRKIRFFLAGLATIIFLTTPWWLSRIVSISPSVYGGIGFGEGVIMIFIWCWALRDGLAAWIGLRLLLGTGGTVGFIYVATTVKEFSSVYPVAVPIATTLLFTGAIVCWLSCLYWPEFDKVKTNSCF
ncbi:MAG: hypothetical protein A3A94_00730 [Candidatus Portnoybacteria bacterium RIFCSPLOWO2_01_FULL_43_11]|uniref:Uncharacterized protein n=4 Tax=Candidatus Portnoyibacteriota TaxID=1817913 RepID=A0A1G2FCW3_9BACT|nr:MAG: hypothetical protein A2815_01565 [Candidatus Portnoybacteria bacterium RIFCSPHIGHO2_01_FULL_40_12b]OGZ36672.1 MAG: hypothetical protein A3D38_00195 [Candidatus Portnoybacteria bacterium RIFCSPHIGHO2_02_FULL_40_23]OGZ38556.1 MAG: hypothetical protein A3A94_00730 [Candidatus Portnoybacteria bacterium RIFCSPLOWO2_01_FULL_43_11]OGZ38902.1 MAG: hypothetical protein A3E90_02430 [Candidatus Portnoybacteria bacterium RIFCSPHIGHO2_12_FULL_40_11]OGZ40951.1 MAG: hypothetical protein A3I20_02930 [C